MRQQDHCAAGGCGSGHREKREVTLDGVWDTKRQALAHGFALCDRETNRWKLLDDALTETGSFDAENVDGFFLI